MTTVNGPSAGVPIVADSAPRVRLKIEKGQGVGTTIECRRVVTLVGSRSGCKLRLQHRQVSPVHVALINNGREIVAVDLITRQGTFLNELKMEHEQLSDGDLLTIDPWRIRVEIQQPQSRGDADLHPFSLEPSPQVIALEHLTTGRILKPNRDGCVIGRRTGCDIVISDRRISRTHSLLLTYFGQLAVFDLLSQNQVRVNGEPVVYQVLQNNDELGIGDTRFRVRMVESKVGNGRAGKKAEPFSPGVSLSEDHPPDMIDIEAVEGSQSWKIADSLEKARRRSPST